MDSESEILDDEEEILVYVEFEGAIGNNTLNDKHLQLDITGIDTDHPIMQINGRFYEGTYEDAVGTYLFFENDKNPIIDDPVFDVNPTLKYFAKTRKLLKMQRVFTKQHTEVLGDSEHPDCIPNIRTIREAGVPPKYEEGALEFWKTIRDKRLNELSAYLEKQRIREEKKSLGIMPESDSDEDNPFAMYKQETKHTAVGVIKELDEVLQRTDKFREDCNIELSDAIGNVTINEMYKASESNEDKFNFEPEPSTSTNFTKRDCAKNVGHIETVKCTRKKSEKFINKKSVEKVKKSSCNLNDKNEEESSAMASPVNSVKQESLPVESNTLKCKSEKNDTKLLKREAKMKEISANLKKIAEEKRLLNYKVFNGE